MVSLPQIFQGDTRRLSTSVDQGGNSESDISKYFCDNCSNELSLPVQNVNRQILREYEEKCAQIRNMQRLLKRESSTDVDDDRRHILSYINESSSFQISAKSKETLQVYAFGFPLISQSQLLLPPENGFDYEHLKNNILKRQSRCNILRRTPQLRRDEKNVRSRNFKNNVRRLPSLTTTIERHPRICDSQISSRPREVLIADPEEIVFDNFEVGRYYEKKCKITNVSGGKCRFHILPMDDSSQFRVAYNKATNPLAAGLSFIVTVQFHCQSLADVEDCFVVRPNTGEELVVTIVAESEPPCLVEANDEECNMDRVVDSFIDLGSHFVGEKAQTIITLKNIGSSARFCFVTESDWVNLELNMDASNILRIDSFTIRPMCFSLKEDQEITIYVSAVPPTSGLHAIAVMLLCDNGALNHIDLVCDGVLFQPSLIDHFNMLKTFDIDKQDVDLAECILDFGQMLTFDKSYHFFFLCNTASVGVNYHWELRTVAFPGTEPLPEIALGIIPMRGRFGAQESEVFGMRLNTTSVPPGVYRALVVLVIDDLPIKCIPLQYSEKLLPLDEESDTDLRSIEAKYIEVWVECVSPSISLCPYVIDLTDSPLVSGSTVEREVVVRNASPGSLELTWKCFDNSSPVNVSIDPPCIKCKTNSSFKCTLSIEAVQEGFFEMSCWCISDREDAKVELLVKGYCSKPRLTTLTDSIDFGLVKVGSHQTTAIVAKNCSSSDSFQWAVDELCFNSPDEGLEQDLDVPKSLSTYGGDVCHKNSEILVTYQLPCEDDSLWCSIIEWDGNHIPVIADVQAPDVSLSTYSLSADPLYVGVPNLVRVSVSNHSLVSAAVFWGGPTNKHLESLITVDVEPRCFVLEPKDHLTVEIKLTPNKVGHLENLYMPCFVEGNAQPLLLKLQGKVEGLSVRVEWDSLCQHCCVFWPPKDNEQQELQGDPPQKPLFKCPPNSVDTSVSSLHANYDTYTTNIDQQIDKISDRSPVRSMSEVPFKDLHNQETIDEEDNISVASSIPYLNWPLVGGRYTRGAMDEEWENHLDNLFIMEELSREINLDTNDDLLLKKNSLCFHDIPLKKAITHTIYIRNDTSIPSTFEASVVYNFERVCKSDDPLDPEAILKKIKRPCREYVERASPQRGLTVFVTPESGQLAPHDYVTLSVTVVALSWGRYWDTIVLQVGDLDHVCVNLSAFVAHPPITAPSLVEFGSLPPRSPPVSRGFKIENTSTVPVYVCWDIFTPTTDELPFSVTLFDNDPFDLQLTDYRGSHTSPYFCVLEKYTLLHPHSSKFVEVNFDPSLTTVNVENKEFSNTLKAVMLGHIYMTDEGRLVSKNENCTRPEGSKFPPLRVTIRGQVEVALLSLLNVFNYQLSFVCTASDVMKSENHIWISENVIKVQNNSRTTLEAKVYTVGFFHVTKIKYPCPDNSGKNSKSHLLLRPGETCDVTLASRVTESDLLECFDPDTEGLDEEMIGMCSEEKGLLCFEQRDVRQDVQLQLYLYPPLLHISENSLDFGSVYIEDTKSLIVKITAPINEEYFEVFLKSGKSAPFFINKTSGILKPKISYLLQVFFSPRECTFYQDVLVVQSCLQKMFREIPLHGIGTFDYRAHTY